ncbi:hypothetical protein SAMN04487917_1036 [Arthrobacter sp. yr096]|nr:hypothetical protein SAMN04487917_1036 [Arthrobacter sp. yr096]
MNHADLLECVYRVNVSVAPSPSSASAFLRLVSVIHRRGTDVQSVAYTVTADSNAHMTATFKSFPGRAATLVRSLQGAVCVTDAWLEVWSTDDWAPQTL